MHTDIKAALLRIDKIWRLFEHRGKRMTKKQVTSVLQYGIKKGYKSTSEISDSEVDNIIKPINN